MNNINGTSALAVPSVSEDYPQMRKDTYSCGFASKNNESAEEKFLAEQKALENSGKWLPPMQTNKLSVSAVTTMELPIVAANIRGDCCIINRNNNYETGDEALFDTATGSGLLISYDGKIIGIRPTAMGGLHNAAKLFGSAFSRMEKSIEAEVLQHGLDVATGSSILLERAGKVTGIHSSKYVIMPISSMLESGKKVLKDNFGEVVFHSGVVSHSKTTCRWLLAGAQQQMMQRYQDALYVSGVAINQNWMPVVDFFSSDTQSSAAYAIPGFMNPDTGDVFRFTEGIQVKHERASDKSGKEGVDLFIHKLNDLYALWEESAKKIEEMASFPLRHPENALIEISIRIGMPKKYAVKCLDTMEQIAINTPIITMHEVYLCLAMAPRFARTDTTTLTLPSPATLLGLEEAVAKILTIPTKEWSNFDVAGHSGWKN